MKKTLKYEETRIIGTVGPKKRAVSEWKADPGSFDDAAHAAFHYATKLKKTMAIVPGNSYMHKVYFIVELEKCDLRTYGAFGGKVPIGIVSPDGSVRQASAEMV